MDYEEKDTEPTMASESALAYEPIARIARRSDIEATCMTLEESKKLVLEMVHNHFHPKS